nr:MAG TPA: hypothetical protein [Crassvirales sp.]
MKVATKVEWDTSNTSLIYGSSARSIKTIH